MIKKLALVCSLLAGSMPAFASPASAWTVVGPHGGVAHGVGYHGWGRGCCRGGAVAAGVATGAVVGAAVASSRYYPPAPVYVPPPPYYIYAPGYYIR